MSPHVTLEELAEAQADLLPDDRAHEIARHVSDCADCARQAAELRFVPALLAAQPTPAMPAEVQARLSHTLGEASRQRTERRTTTSEGSRSGGPSLGGDSVTPVVKPNLGRVGDGLPGLTLRSFLPRAVLACALAAAAGLAGYVVSATFGMNEPQATGAVSVQSSQLAAQAATIQDSHDPSPHFFSDAWQCARQVADGRVTGVLAAVVDGRSGLLVYSQENGRTYATAVAGCDTPTPSVAPAVQLPR